MKVKRTHIRTGRTEVLRVPAPPYGPVFESPEQYTAKMNAMHPKLWHYEPVKKETAR